MSDIAIATQRVKSVLENAGFSVGVDDPCGKYSSDGQGETTGIAALGYYRALHGHAITVLTNIPGADRVVEARVAQIAMADLFARVLYDAGLCPASRLAWKNNSLLVVPIELA